MAAPRDTSGRVLLPDLALCDSPRFAEMTWWPIYLNTDPIWSWQWIRNSRLSYLLWVTGLERTAQRDGLCFVPSEKLPPDALNGLLKRLETSAFLLKYWPSLRPAQP